jgi:outer membrane protein
MLMQYPFNDPFELIMPANIQTLMAQTGTADDIYRAAVSKLPQVRAAVLQKEAADIQIRVSKSLWSPTVSLYGSVSTVFSENAKEITGVNINGTQVIGVTQNGNENVVQPIYSFQTKTIDFNKQLRDNIGQSAGISLSWNLFNGFQAQNQIAKSKINSQVSGLNLKRVENSLMNEINLAYNNYLAATQRYAATSKSVEAQQNNLNYIQKRYEAGATNVFELTQAKNNYSMATSNEIQAKYEVVFRALIIEFYKGNPIAL